MSTSASLTTLKKAVDCADHSNCEKFLKTWEYQTILPVSWETCMWGQKATVRTLDGTTDWFKTGKGVRQDCILSPCLFNLHAEYIMQNARLDEAQAWIKTTGRNINNLTYEDDNILMAESEEELKSLLMRVKGEWKRWLKTQTQLQKPKIIASNPTTSWQTEWEKVEVVIDLIFLDSKIIIIFILAKIRNNPNYYQ